MELTSKAFIDGSDIPVKYTGEGRDISPPLEWSGVPNACQELAIICEDPDTSKKAGKVHPFVHWIIYNISPTVTALPEGRPQMSHLDVPIRADQGQNSFGNLGYGGPMPPVDHGAHRYVFTLYALNKELRVPPGATKSDLLKAMQRHVIDSTKLTGNYERKSAEKVA